MDDDSGLYDSDYSFNSDRNEADQGNGDAHGIGTGAMEVDIRTQVHAYDGEEIENEYDASEELHSCSSTDEEAEGQSRPKYPDFVEEIDIKDPHLKVGMKFTSFMQFREAVRNYGIKHRVVMNFKPSNSKRCKAICKKGCPFYLWVASMIKDKKTFQINSGILTH